MPFTAKTFKEKHNKNLTDAEAKTAVKIANDLIKKGYSDGDAIHIANGIIKKNRQTRKNKKKTQK